MKKEQKLYGILKMKCPACHEGDLFEKAGYFNLNKMGNNLDKCEVCGQDFKIEPGFYWGALYLAYGLMVFLSLILFLLFFLLLNLSLNTSFILLIIIDLLLTPLIYKLSKSLWIHIFISYRPRKK